MLEIEITFLHSVLRMALGEGQYGSVCNSYNY